MPVTGHHLDITFVTISLTATRAQNTCTFEAATIAYGNVVTASNTQNVAACQA